MGTNGCKTSCLMQGTLSSEYTILRPRAIQCIQARGGRRACKLDAHNRMNRFDVGAQQTLEMCCRSAIVRHALWWLPWRFVEGLDRLTEARYVRCAAVASVCCATVALRIGRFASICAGRWSDAGTAKRSCANGTQRSRA